MNYPWREYLEQINRLAAELQQAIAEARNSSSFVDVKALEASLVTGLRNVAFLSTTYVTESNWGAWSESAQATVASLSGALRLAGKYSAEGVAGQVAANLGAVAVNVATDAGEAVKTGLAVGTGTLVLLVAAIILVKVL